MPIRSERIRQRREMALRSGSTIFLTDFHYICKQRPDRIGIVAEGDSWFAYPRKWFAFGGDINIIHHLFEKIEDSGRVNLLRLASNGDEAVDMTSGKQFKKLYRILKKNKRYIQLVLFSGGGNDIVGKHDMLPLLNLHENGYSFLDCINLPRFERKIAAIKLAYQRLISLCEDLVPNAKIVTHTYDIAQPWDQGAKFFWGLIETNPWIYPYLMRKKIPTELHLPVIEYMLKTFAAMLLELAAEESTQGRLIVVNTQGTLRPGSRTDWLNEIHPTRAGFKKVFNKIYAAMKEITPGLPD